MQAHGRGGAGLGLQSLAVAGGAVVARTGAGGGTDRPVEFRGVADDIGSCCAVGFVGVEQCLGAQQSFGIERR